MDRRVDDLWEFSTDGKSETAGTSLGRSEGELQPLLDAWFRERSRRIEAVLILDEVRRLLKSLVDDPALDRRRSHQARRILRVIHEFGDDLD